MAKEAIFDERNVFLLYYNSIEKSVKFDWLNHDKLMKKLVSMCKFEILYTYMKKTVL